MLKTLALSELRPDPANPKHHALASIEASLRRFGLGAPFVIDDRTGLLSSGHGRREALLAMRARGEPPPAGVDVRLEGEAEEWIVPAETWTSADDREAHAFLVAANRLTEQGGWNAPHLNRILEILGPSRLAGVGFDEHDLATVRMAAAAAAASVPIPRPIREFECPSCQHRFPAKT